MNHFTFTAANETDTARLGAALAQALPAGTVVAFYGTLGAGKTRLVQAVADALGIDRRQVVSPTSCLSRSITAKNPFITLTLIDCATKMNSWPWARMSISIPTALCLSSGPTACRLSAPGKSGRPHRSNR